MTKTPTILILIIIFAVFPSISLANSAPVVSNVSASQRADDSKLVDIYYNLADADGDLCTVWVIISDNNGLSWTVPAMTFTGAVGSNVSPGVNKHVIWDAGKDISGKVGDYKTRVFVDDGHGSSDMVLVAAGYFNYQNTTPPIYLPSFFIDKYEVTNARYCEFLNNADPIGSHYSSSMEINRTGSSGNYTYTTISGKENFPIRFVLRDDASAFATWCSQIYGGNYRLPTEQEWEKAAAWDPVEQHYYIYGFHRDAIDCNWCNYNTCYGDPLPVGSFNGTSGKNDAKSYYGCYDMSGNVWEWTSGSGALVSCSSTWVIGWVTRGGAWTDACLISQRSAINCPGVRYANIGLRLVREIQ